MLYQDIINLKVQIYCLEHNKSVDFYKQMEEEGFTSSVIMRKTNISKTQYYKWCLVNEETFIKHLQSRSTFKLDSYREYIMVKLYQSWSFNRNFVSDMYSPLGGNFVSDSSMLLTQFAATVRCFSLLLTQFAATVCSFSVLLTQFAATVGAFVMLLT